MKLFATEGRLNRAPYIGYTIGLSVLAVVLLIALIVACIPFLPADGDFENIDEAAFESGMILGIFVFMMIYLLLATIINITLSIRRLHDLDKDGMFVLLTFVPTVNFIFYLYLCIVKGTEGSNKYGEDPLQK